MIDTTNQRAVQQYNSGINSNYAAANQSYNNYVQNNMNAVNSAYQGFNQSIQAASYSYESHIKSLDTYMRNARSLNQTADQIVGAMSEQNRNDTQRGYQRVGELRTAIAASGLAYSGSALWMIDETVNESVKEAKNNFLNLAGQEANLRNQRNELITQYFQGEQLARQNLVNGVDAANKQLSNTLSLG